MKITTRSRDGVAILEPEGRIMVGAADRTLFDRVIPQASQEDAGELSLENRLEELGFDRIQHAQIRADLRSGRIGLAQNRLPASTEIRDVDPEDVIDINAGE